MAPAGTSASLQQAIEESLLHPALTIVSAAEAFDPTAFFLKSGAEVGVLAVPVALPGTLGAGQLGAAAGPDPPGAGEDPGVDNASDGGPPVAYDGVPFASDGAATPQPRRGAVQAAVA